MSNINAYILSKLRATTQCMLFNHRKALVYFQVFVILSYFSLLMIVWLFGYSLRKHVASKQCFYI